MVLLRSLFYTADNRHVFNDKNIRLYGKTEVPFKLQFKILMHLIAGKLN